MGSLVAGVLFDQGQTTLIQYPAGKAGAPYTIPNSVTSIGNYAFQGSTGLTSVTLGNSVTSIGDYAFGGCTGLTSITFPGGVTSLGVEAFGYSTSLTAAYFQGNAPSADSTAFDGDISVTVYYLTGTTGWGSPFAGRPAIQVPAYSIAVSASPVAGGTVSGSGTFLSGTSQTVTATANSGYGFINWTENGNAVSSAASYTFTLSANRTLVANFSGTPPTLTSANAATFTLGQPGSFTVVATGTPTATYSATGLPAWASLNATTGVISGTPPALTGSPFSITLTASNGVAPAAMQAFILQVPTTFTAWQAAQFGSNAAVPSIAGDTADPNHTGVANLLAYALGLTPGTATRANLPALTSPVDGADGKRHLLLTALLDPNATDVTVSAEVSADLVTWQSGAGFTEVVSDTTANGVRTLVLRDLTPMAGNTKRFMHLKVTRP